MSIALKTVLELVDGVLDNGLAFAALYLEKILNRPVIIADGNGKICYPEIIPSHNINDIFVPLPISINQREYFYQEENKSLYYRIQYSDENAYVVIKDFAADRVSQAIKIMREAQLAIKCYFCKINKHQDMFEKELAEYLFSQSSADIRDIVKLSDKELDINRPYFVMLAEVEQVKPHNNIQFICSYSSEYFRSKKLDVISLYQPNFLVFCLPACLQNDVGGISLKQFILTDSVSYKGLIENKFGISIAMGIGQIYPLLNLQRSYNEARISLTLPRLMGKKGFIKQFSQLGLFSPIFHQELEAIKDYCINTLGKLLEYDEKNDGELLPTLRHLLDSCFSVKSTADSLFIHVNTLYYRINKIEQILNADLSKMDTRVELYTAIKVWDVLRANNLNKSVKARIAPFNPYTLPEYHLLTDNRRKLAR